MTFKDWMMLTISCLALAVSVATALFNVIVQQDDIRVVIGEPLTVWTSDRVLHLSGHARKASEIVMLTFRMLHCSRFAMLSAFAFASARSSSSQRRLRAIESSKSHAHPTAR